jgi:hypothetical protein
MPVTAGEAGMIFTQSESGICRDTHTYRTAPNAAIVQHIFSLASSKSAAIRMANQVASQVLHLQVNVPPEQLRVSSTGVGDFLFNCLTSLLHQTSRHVSLGGGGGPSRCPQMDPLAQNSCGYGPAEASISASSLIDGVIIASSNISNAAAYG